MDYVAFSFVVVIAVSEHLHWIPHNPFVTLKISQSQSHLYNPFVGSNSVVDASLAWKAHWHGVTVAVTAINTSNRTFIRYTSIPNIANLLTSIWRSCWRHRDTPHLWKTQRTGFHKKPRFLPRVLDLLSSVCWKQLIQIKAIFNSNQFGIAIVNDNFVSHSCTKLKGCLHGNHCNCNITITTNGLHGIYCHYHNCTMWKLTFITCTTHLLR